MPGKHFLFNHGQIWGRIVYLAMVYRDGYSEDQENLVKLQAVSSLPYSSPLKRKVHLN